MSILVGATSGLAGAAGQGGGADLGEPINQSLRFTGDGRLVASTSATTGNFTISFWWKRAVGVNATHTFFMFTPNQAYQFTQNNDDRFASRVTSFDYLSDGSLRDHSAWYHIVLVNNSGTTTLHINGVQQSDTATTPSGGGNMCIGSNSTSVQDDRLVGYLAEYNLLDGQTLSPTDFGRYNDDGVWVPIELSFTSAQYGAKGFRLVFDSSADGGIGDDSAPTGTGHTAANDFTATGFDETAISASNFDNDIDYEDTPTKNYCTLNPLDVNVIAEANVRNGNLTTGTSTASNQVSLRSTHFKGSGKWYYEVENPAASGTNIQAGWATHTAVHRFESTSTGVHTKGLPNSTVVMVAADFDNNAIWFGEDGTWDNSATQSEIESGDTSNASVTSVGNYPQSPAFLDQAGSFSGSANFNFGQRSFVYTVPSGFEALNTDQIAEPTIKNGKEHFGILTYTGDGATTSGQTVTDTDAVPFTPDLVWIKKRGDNGGATAVREHILIDSVRGKDGSYYWNLSSNDALAETSSDHVSAIGEGSITVHDITSGTVNQNLNTFVAWCWKAGGTAVSNTDGTITSSVSANTDAGFSIVSYTGTSTSGATIGHGLSSAPEWILTKNRDTSADWAVYHVAQDATAPENEYMALNTSDATATASDRWNNTAPTSTVFTVGDAVQTNGANDMIAYCWHSVEGYSKFGSYTGNGSADGTYVELGFKPALIILKSSSSAFDWQIYDSTRSANNPATLTLSPNQTASEVTSGNDLDILSNGFKARDNGSINNNSGSTYVYMAFAESPFGGENAPPATAR